MVNEIVISFPNFICGRFLFQFQLGRNLCVSVADFPKTRVPVVLSPLLYSDMEDLAISKAFRESNGLNQVNVSEPIC